MKKELGWYRRNINFFYLLNDILVLRYKYYINNTSKTSYYNSFLNINKG